MAAPAPRFDNAVARAAIDNVFDEEYSMHPNGLDRPGRTFRVSATVTF